MDIVDLTVTHYCERVYALQREIEEQPVADDVSRVDYRALQLAVRDLYATVLTKLASP